MSFFTDAHPHSARLLAGDFSDTLVQGRLVHAMRYLASVVTQCFTAFGELLGMHKRLAELSGGITRVSEMMDTMSTAAEQEATLRLADAPCSAPPPCPLRTWLTKGAAAYKGVATAAE